MRTLLWILLVLFSLAATWLRVGSGGGGWLVPQVGLCAVLLCARWSPPRRYRTAALLAGLVSGLPLEMGWLVPSMILLFLGAMAHATRRFFPVERLPGFLLLGTAYAVVQAVLFLLFSAEAYPFMLARGGGSRAALGMLFTGVIFACLEVLVRRSARLRHALERP